MARRSQIPGEVRWFVVSQVSKASAVGKRRGVGDVSLEDDGFTVGDGLGDGFTVGWTRGFVMRLGIVWRGIGDRRR